MPSSGEHHSARKLTYDRAREGSLEECSGKTFHEAVFGGKSTRLCHATFDYHTRTRCKSRDAARFETTADSTRGGVVECK